MSKRISCVSAGRDKNNFIVLVGASYDIVNGVMFTEDDDDDEIEIEVPPIPSSTPNRFRGWCLRECGKTFEGKLEMVGDAGIGIGGIPFDWMLSRHEEHDNQYAFFCIECLTKEGVKISPSTDYLH